MKARDRILNAAMLVFRRHGFRRSSIEQAAEAAGLTRQALYHHFKSKEALFRAVIEQVHENAMAAEMAAADAEEKAGGDLADILIAQITGRLRQVIASFDGSSHVEELFSEHLIQARDLYQKYAALYVARGAATIERVCRRQRLALAAGITSNELARCIEMAVRGAKSAHPSMQPAANPSRRSKASVPANCTRCRRPSWRTMRCNADSAPPALSLKLQRFTTAGGPPRER